MMASGLQSLAIDGEEQFPSFWISRRRTFSCGVLAGFVFTSIVFFFYKDETGSIHVAKFIAAAGRSPPAQAHMGLASGQSAQVVPPVRAISNWPTTDDTEQTAAQQTTFTKMSGHQIAQQLEYKVRGSDVRLDSNVQMQETTGHAHQKGGGKMGAMQRPSGILISGQQPWLPVNIMMFVMALVFKGVVFTVRSKLRPDRNISPKRVGYMLRAPAVLMTAGNDAAMSEAEKPLENLAVEKNDDRLEDGADKNGNEEVTEIMSDDPLVLRLEAECKALNGSDWNSNIGLPQLLNPSKVINLEQNLVKLRTELNATVDGDARSKLQLEIDEKEKKKTQEMRGVMRGWLKAVFVWQSLLSLVIFGLVCYDAVPGFPNLDIIVQVCGFWGIWLFTIPSLRSRKPGGTWGMSNAEKKALDVGFLIVPVVNVITPFFTKYPPNIFWANLVTLALCYIYGFANPDSAGMADASLPAPLKFAMKAVDFGSGQERGMTKERREAWEEKRRQEKNNQQRQ